MEGDRGEGDRGTRGQETERELGTGRVQEAGEERVVSRIPKVAERGEIEKNFVTLRNS